MLRTPLCDLVGIDVPVIQAGMSIYTSPKLAAAVSNAGALGSLGVWQRPAEQLRRDLDELRDATDRPFAVNHVVPDLDPEAFEITLDREPAVVAFALDDAGDLMQRVHDVGSIVMQQVSTVEQAFAAVEHGADIIVAQGGEAGGYGGSVATLALVPQVVDAVRPTPVVAAGRYRRRTRVGGRPGARRRGRESRHAVPGLRGISGRRCVEEGDHRFGLPVMGAARLRQRHQTEPRQPRLPDSSAGASERVHRPVGATPRRAAHGSDGRAREMAAAAAEGNFEELFIGGGQSAGIIGELLPAADVIGMLVAEAEEALATAGRLAR